MPQRIKGQFSTPDEPGGTKTMLWIAANRDHKGDDCLTWPYGTNHAGYAMVGRGGTTIYVSRYMCEYRHGPAPSARHYALHSCGNGHLGCVNPMHMRWGTPSENQLERFAMRGGGLRRYNLPDGDILEIRRLSGVEPNPVIAKRFGVSASYVQLVRAGKVRAKPPAHRVFTEDEVIEIRERKQSLSQAAKLYGATPAAIDRIRNGKSYKWVPNSRNDLDVDKGRQS